MRKQIEKEEYIKLPIYKKIFYRINHHFTTVDEAYKARPKKWIYNLVFILVLACFLLYFSLDINFFSSFKSPNWEKFGKMLEGFIHPNWSYFFGYGSFTFKSSVFMKLFKHSQ